MVTADPALWIMLNNSLVCLIELKEEMLIVNPGNYQICNG